MDLRNTALSFQQCLIGWLILFPVFLLISPLVICLTLFRHACNLVVHIRYSGSWVPVQAADCVYSFRQPNLDPQNNGVVKYCGRNIGSVSVLESHQGADGTKHRLEIHELLDEVTDRLLNNPEFAQLKWIPRSFLGYGYWDKSCTEKMDVTANVKEWIVPKGQAFNLNEMYSNWLPCKFDGMSPWEMILVNPSTEDYAEKSVIFLKINHILGDGITILLLAQKLFQRDVIIPKIPRQVYKLSIPQQIYQAAILPKTLLKLMSMQNLETFNEPNHINETHGGVDNHHEEPGKCYLGSIDLQEVKLCARKLGINFLELCAWISLRAFQVYNQQHRQSQYKGKMCYLVAIPWLYSYRCAIFGSTGVALLLSVSTDNVIRPKQLSNLIKTAIAEGMDRIIILFSYLIYILPMSLVKMFGIGELPAGLMATSLQFPGDGDPKQQPQRLVFEKYKCSATFGNMSLFEAPKTGGIVTFTTFGDRVFLSIVGNHKLFLYQKDVDTFGDIIQNILQEIGQDLHAAELVERELLLVV